MSSYISLIDLTEMRVVKGYLRAGQDIKEVIICREGHLAKVAALLDCDSSAERRERGLALAERGIIRFAVDTPLDRVPEPWRKYAVPLEDHPDKTACRVIYQPPAYLVQPEGRTPTIASGRENQGTKQPEERPQAKGKRFEIER